MYSYYFATLKTITWFYGFYLCCSIYLFFDFLIFQPSVTLVVDFIVPSIAAFPIHKVIDDLSTLFIASGLMQPPEITTGDEVTPAASASGEEGSGLLETPSEALVVEVKSKYKEVVKNMSIPSFKKKTPAPSAVVPVAHDFTHDGAIPSLPGAEDSVAAAPAAAVSGREGVYIRKNLLTGLGDDSDDDDGRPNRPYYLTQMISRFNDLRSITS